MKHSYVFIAAAILVFYSACGFSLKDNASPQALQYQNLIANEFGLEPGEIALTLDDGPGPRSLELARWLASEDIPVTYFMIGENAATRPSTVKAISELKLTDGSPAFVIANHTMTHENDSLSTNYAAEILKADKILSPYIKGDFFFRPPYGNLLTETWLKQKPNESDEAFAARLVAARNADRARVDKLNSTADLDKYIGPVLWNVGTSMANDYSADWECWTLPSPNEQRMQRCIDGYLNNVTDLQNEGAVILAHDIHSLTVDMLMGTGPAKGRSLVRELKARGYRFVALNKNPSAYARYRNRPLQTQSHLSALFVEKNNQRYLSVVADNASYLRVTLNDLILFAGTYSAHDDRLILLPSSMDLNQSGFLKLESFELGRKVAELYRPLQKH